MKRLADVMTREVTTITPRTPLRETAQLMAKHDVGILPVVEDRNRLVGIVTDRDIVVRAVAKDAVPREMTVSEVMSDRPVSCREDHSIEDAAKLMQEHRLRRIMVLDKDQQIVGVVSLGDIARKAGDHKVTGKTMQEVAAGA